MATATRNVDVTTDPTDIVSSHSLVVGTRYTLQNVDPAGRIFVRQAAVKPTGGALRGFVIPPFGDATITPTAGIGVWLWTDRAESCAAVLDTVA